MISLIVDNKITIQKFIIIDVINSESVLEFISKFINIIKMIAGKNIASKGIKAM
ncbi:hypothetical protein [Hymenobacter endophyticus]|uniref:hypothetical protein n=1 Tax=Hymenobacter endophyticus TaxID=3076335 RepID=UPI002905D795|nr:hypothetical protein [Hymenobacter endophyticus]